MNTDTTKHKRSDESCKRAAGEHWQVSAHRATQIAAELGDAARN